MNDEDVDFLPAVPRSRREKKLKQARNCEHRPVGIGRGEKRHEQPGTVVSFQEANHLTVPVQCTSTPSPAERNGVPQKYEDENCMSYSVSSSVLGMACDEKTAAPSSDASPHPSTTRGCDHCACYPIIVPMAWGSNIPGGESDECASASSSEGDSPSTSEELNQPSPTPGKNQQSPYCSDGGEQPEFERHGFPSAAQFDERGVCIPSILQPTTFAAFPSTVLGPPGGECFGQAQLLARSPRRRYGTRTVSCLESEEEFVEFFVPGSNNATSHCFSRD